MARAIWSGSVSFGLVNVPVRALTAVRDHEVHFHQLVKGSGARIHNQKVSPKGEELDPSQIELGYELEPGRHVVVDPEELDRLRPRTTRTIDISDFVDLADIDPVYFQHTYWLAPDGEAAERAYRLLVAVLTDQQRVGIGTVVMRNKQYLAAVRPLQGALALSTMRFADEVVAAASIDELPSAAKPDTGELRLAGKIVESMATRWQPEQYHDTYTEQLRHLIEQKADGAEPAAQDEEPSAGGEVVDLMAALEASLAQAKEDGTGRRRPAGGASRPSSTRSRAKPAGARAGASGGGRRRAAAEQQPTTAKRATGQAKTKKASRSSAASKSA